MTTSYDYAIIGSGVGGLFTGALLAKAGKKVYVAEKHYALGGYGHSFREGAYDFCGQLHYLWNCLPHEPGHAIFKKLGLENEVPFSRLDPDGFDHVFFPGQYYKIKSGFARNIEDLSREFPSHRRKIRNYFEVIHAIDEAIYRLPIDFNWGSLAFHPIQTRMLIRYYGYTLQRFFDELDLPKPLQNLLSGQSGNLLCPPEKVSLFIHAGMVAGYDRGACVPSKGFRHMFSQVSKVILSNGGRIALRNEVKGLCFEGDSLVGIDTQRGGQVRARNVVLNADPTVLLKWLPHQKLSPSFRKKLKFSYSPSCFTIYLGLKDIDLSQHGFGNWNVWFYQHNDINQVYRANLDQDDLSSPALFISTPSLHKTTQELKGRQQMVICAMCNYEPFKKLLDSDRELYLAKKEVLKQRILDVIEKNFVPGLRNHIDVCITGSPTTNEFYVGSVFGNAYGADLTPANFRFNRLNSKTPIHNLHLVGACASVPSFAGGIHYSNLLADKLIKLDT